MLARFLPLVLLVMAVGCGTKINQGPVLGQAFAGPATLTLRAELNPKSATVATAVHGDRLEIVENRRRFVRVRTSRGVEGWTDSRLLLTPDQMAQLRKLADDAKATPTFGLATTFEPLNMHTDPNRLSATFYQIPEGGKVDVIAHKLAPRLQAPPAGFTVAPVKPRVPRRRKEKNTGKTFKMPAPPVPRPPSNWLDLSKTPKPGEVRVVKPETHVNPAVPTTPAIVAYDDWSLVRSKDGHAGWVLSRMVSLAIPDDVAQYAEGHRITSYFRLGEVHDGDLVKPNWLWTTMTKGGEPYDFDSFRVFFWSRNHHRYETQYIERKLIGHFPVTVRAGEVPSFSVITEDDDGKWFRRTFTFEAYRFRQTDKVAYDPAAPPPAPAPIAQAPTGGGAAPSRSFLSGVKEKLSHTFGK